MNLTVKHCFEYLRSLHPASVCGIRGKPTQTLIARIAKHATGTQYGFAYQGGDILEIPSGKYVRLTGSVQRIAQEFEDCRVNDFGAYDVDEDGLTKGVYTRISIGAWYKSYHFNDCLKAYSPDVYQRTRKPRKRTV